MRAWLLLRGASQMPPQLFALYNYKGGVGKSTLTINLAATFANRGYKTLIIDCDPQCNTTTFFLPDAVKGSKKPEPEEAKLEAADSDTDVAPAGAAAAALSSATGVFPEDVCRPRRIGDAVLDYETLLSGERSPFGADVSDVFKMMKPLLQPSAHTRFAVPGTFFTGEKNLWLLPGSGRVSEFESTYSSLLGVTLQQRAEFVGALRYAVDALCKANDFEVVLLDFSPNAGVINKALVMACDFIIPPCFADYFSLSSVHGLLYSVLPDWLAWRTGAIAWQADSVVELPAAYRLPTQPPKLLPFLIGNYRVSSSHAPQGVQYIIKGEAVFVHALKELMLKASVPSVSREIFVAPRQRMVIAFLRDMGAINDIAHCVGVPVVNLDKAFLMDKQKWGVPERDAVGYIISADRTRQCFEDLTKCMRVWCHMPPPTNPTAGAHGATGGAAGVAAGAGNGGGTKRAHDGSGASAQTPAKKTSVGGGAACGSSPPPAFSTGDDMGLTTAVFFAAVGERVSRKQLKSRLQALMDRAEAEGNLTRFLGRLLYLLEKYTTQDHNFYVRKV